MAKAKNSFYDYLGREDKEHVLVVDFIKRFLPDVVVFHVPNEGKRSAFERFKMSIMGTMKGVHDFVFLHPKIEEGELIYMGLTIELKAPAVTQLCLKGKKAGQMVKYPAGKPTPEQIDVQKKLQKRGYHSVICTGSEQAIAVIKQYFDL